MDVTCRRLMVRLNNAYTITHDVDAALKFVASAEEMDFLYSPVFLQDNEWKALVDGDYYVITFNCMFYAKEYQI